MTGPHWASDLRPFIPPERVRTIAIQATQDPDHPDSLRYAEHYWHNAPHLEAQLAAPLLRPVLRRLGIGAGHAVLDVASGPGAKSRLLAETGASVVAVDLDDDVLFPNSRPDAVAFVQADLAQSFPFPDHSFDAVYGGNLPYDLYNPHIYAELRRVLKPGGHLLLETHQALPTLLYAWDLPFNSRVEAAHRAYHMDTAYGDRVTAGDSYEARYHAACAALGLIPQAHVQTITQPVPPWVEQLYLHQFALVTAPFVRPYLTGDDWRRLCDLHDPTTGAYLFKRPDLFIVQGVTLASGNST